MVEKLSRIAVTNYIWNIAGLLVPLLAAMAVIPNLINAIGTERFGIIGLTWGVLAAAAAGVVDMNIGRALTRHIAVNIENGRTSDTEIAVGVSFGLCVITGLLAWGGLTILALVGAFDGLTNSPELQHEVRWAFVIIAVTLPIQAIIAVKRAICESNYSFIGVNIVRSFVGVSTFAGPLLASAVSTHLGVLVLPIVASRIAALLAYDVLSKPFVLRDRNLNSALSLKSRRQIRREILRFSGWSLISTAAPQIFALLERFSIGFLLTSASLTVFLIPYEIVSQSLFVVGAATNVVFPYFIREIARHRDAALRMFVKSTLFCFALMLIVAFILMKMFPAILEIWFGGAVSSASGTLGQLLAIGLPFYAARSMSITWLQASHGVRLVALIQLAEVPLYCGFLWRAIYLDGLEGAATAWSTRIVLEGVVLMLVLMWIEKIRKPVLRQMD